MALSHSFSYASQCQGKRPFSSKADVKRSIRAAERFCGRMIPYRCPHCGAWHMGHKVSPPQPQQALAS